MTSILASNQRALDKVVLFGDSLTDYSFDADNGLGDELIEYFKGRAVVMNRGFPGYTTETVKPEFADLLSDLQRSLTPPLLITIWLGANDACLPPFNAHVPIEKFAENIKVFVDELLLACPETRIMLIAPPPINIPAPAEDPLLEGMSEEYKREVKKREGDPKQGKGYRTWLNKKIYAERVMDLARSYSEAGQNVVGVDVWGALVEEMLKGDDEQQRKRAYDEGCLPGCGLEGAKGFPEGWFLDGLHFGPKGYDVVSRFVTGKMEEMWPELKRG